MPKVWFDSNSSGRITDSIRSPACLESVMRDVLGLQDYKQSWYKGDLSDQQGVRKLQPKISDFYGSRECNKLGERKLNPVPDAVNGN